MPLDQVLRTHPFSAGMPELLIKRLASLSRHVEFEEDEIVFRAGECSTEFGLLLCGSVVIEMRSPYYSITVQSLRPGDAFGWSSLLEGYHTVFQVRAREISSALVVDGQKLSAACKNDPALAAEVYRRLASVMAKRVQATELRLAEFCGSAKHSGAKTERIA